ncbi:EamA family transporter [Paracoccus kondratievae]
MHTDWAHLPLIVWVTLFYVAIFASALTTVLVQFAAMRLPSSKVLAYTYLTPIWVIGVEAVLTHQMPPPVVLPGVLATVAALLLLLKD